jgi:hypothetical protein
MKFLLSLLVLMTFAQVSFAQDDMATDWTTPDCGGSLIGDCDDDDEEDLNYRVCRARDSQGREFRYYTSIHNPATYTQRRAFEKCRASSTRPASCRKAGCTEY